MKNFTQKFLAPGLLALSLVTASGAAMADPCTSCGVVTGTHTEEYKGKATALGTVGGAVVGGILGNQVGKGSGRAAATAVGVIGGAVAGNAIEGRNNPGDYAQGYRISVQLDQGGYRAYDVSSPGDLRIGDRVRLYNGQISRQ